jgi:glycosyltransferase involved in cell wall biosynthesis
MKTLRVCIFTETYYPVVGGGETQARLLAEGLAASGFGVVIVTRRSDAALARREEYGKISVHRLPPTGRGQLKKWGLMLASAPALFKLRHEYDLIFVSGFRIIGVTAVLAARLLGKAVVLKADSQGEMSGAFFAPGLAKLHLKPGSPPFAWFLRARNYVLKRADAFAYITPAVHAEFAAAGIPEAALHDIPNGVDTSRFFPADDACKQRLRTQTGLPLQGKVVVYTGRLVSYKGLPLLVRVWKELAARFPSAILLLVGSGGLDIHNCEAELRAYVQTQNLQGCVRFAGSVQNVPDYLQAADVFALPTEDDALPGALLEAMACGLPVVTTPVGAIASIVRHGENGLLVTPGDCRQLHDALAQVLADSALGRRLGQAGVETVRAQYAAARVTGQYAQLFEQVVH